MRKVSNMGAATLLMAGALLAGACAGVRAQNTPFVEVQKDVVYGQADGESLKLDLYQTPTASSALRPGIVFIHGGGWSGGDKSEFAAMAKEMAERGYVAVSVNYRLAPKYKFPANVEDVQRATRWLRVNGNLLHVDPQRIGSMGASAGGHLASLLGVLEAKGGSIPDQAASARVNCVVDYYGRMDLTLEPTSASFHDYRTDYIGKLKTDALELYREASPINHIDKQTCPFLIVQGVRDGQVEPVQSQNMLAALDKAGIEVSLLLLGGQGHGFNGAGARQAWTAAKEFFDRHLKLGK